MFTELTRALLGTTDLSVAEAIRIHNAMLKDNLLYNRAIEAVIAERIPGVIAALNPLERAALECRMNIIRNTKITIKWEWVPAFRTIRGERPVIRAKRFYGDNTKEEEVLHFPLPETVAALAGYKEPWTGSSPTPDVLALFETWLHTPDAFTQSVMRENALNEAAAAQKKQGKTTGDLAVAINVEKASGSLQFSQPKEGK